MPSTITPFTPVAVNHDSATNLKNQDSGAKGATNEPAAKGEQLPKSQVYTDRKGAFMLRAAAKSKPATQVNDPVDDGTLQIFNKSSVAPSTENAAEWSTFFSRVAQYMPGRFVGSAGKKTDSSESGTSHVDGPVDDATSQVFGKSPITAETPTSTLDEIRNFASRIASYKPGNFPAFPMLR